MRKFSVLLVILFCVGWPLVSNAQLSVLRDSGTGNPILTSPYREVKGSTYFREFQKGIIYLLNGQEAEGLQLALNGYENTLEYKFEGGLFSYPPEKIKGFALLEESGEKLEYTSAYEIPTLSERRFLRVLEKGKYTLLWHQYKIMADDVMATYGAQAAKVFQDQEEFFIAKGDSVFLLKSKAKDLQEIFGDDYEKVNSILKSQKLNLKSQDDVQKLIRQLN